MCDVRRPTAWSWNRGLLPHCAELYGIFLQRELPTLKVMLDSILPSDSPSFLTRACTPQAKTAMKKEDVLMSSGPRRDVH